MAGQADLGQGPLQVGAGGVAAQGPVEGEVLQRAQVGLVARQVAQIGAAPGQVAPVDRPARHEHLAAAGRQQARQHPQQGGLAGAVAAQHQQGLAGAEFEIQGAEHRFFVAGEAEAAGLQQRRGVGGRGRHGRGMLPQAARRRAAAVSDAGPITRSRPGFTNRNRTFD